jgi:hypothetical protein
LGVSSLPGGVLAWSRILNDEEVLIVANSNTNLKQSLDVILEANLSNAGDSLRILYSNKSNPTTPAAIRKLSNVKVSEVDGSIGVLLSRL